MSLEKAKKAAAVAAVKAYFNSEVRVHVTVTQCCNRF
jgi:hypothetical protein